MSLSGDNRSDTTVEDLVLMLSSMDITTPMERRQLVTEVITVPTSEHVAQIVGKSGSKIKNLRARTETMIKTPLRGDEPMFTVTGTPQNVAVAAQAIRGASNHFTKLMREKSPACAVGEVTVKVPVPPQYVGVVVGRNGTVIMKIKEQTNTRINTPKGDSTEPEFEVTGSKANVLAAKEAIMDKVKSAYELKESTIFDPELRHKCKALQQPNNVPNQSAMHLATALASSFGALPSAHHSFNMFGGPSNYGPPPLPSPTLVDRCWSWESSSDFPKLPM